MKTPTCTSCHFEPSAEAHVVLIFGWGQGSVDDRGEVAPVRCPNCHNDVFLHLVRSTKEVSLYFVPVMPYGTDEYLVCRVCGHGLHVALEHQSAVEGMRAATRCSAKAGSRSLTTARGPTDSGSRWVFAGGRRHPCGRRRRQAPEPRSSGAGRSAPLPIGWLSWLASTPRVS